MNHQSILYFLFLSLLYSCENNVNINVPEHESKLVVEGWIDQNFGPRVLLTLSAPFFIEIDSNNLRDFAVTKAKVTISKESKFEVLTLKPNDIYFPPFYYFGTEVRGELAGEYHLEIELSGKKYIATTTIPTLSIPDSIWFEKNSQDSVGRLWITVSDNPDERNYYRVFTKRLCKDERFIPALRSVFSDENLNGERYIIPVAKGNANLLDRDNNTFFSIGDTIIVRFCSIDEEHYNFWKSMETHTLASSNPFAVNNSDVKSNILSGLGIWGGYAVYYDTIIAK